MTAPVLELRRVSRTFSVGDQTVHAVHSVDLRVESGEMLALIGPSGSGKSTVMNVMGLLDTPSSGEYLFGGRPTGELRSADRADLRNQAIGFVFQQFHLLPHLTAIENALLPLRYRGMSFAAARLAAVEALAAVGMEHRSAHRPAQLSGGEKQRVAIARAVAGRPRLLLADEPTGALDSATGERVLEVLLGAARDSGAALVMITHDAGIAQALPRRVAMRDGCIVGAELP
jgi:putative ABC transport system ATP-binding protein